jgi:hypothetical protein
MRRVRYIGRYREVEIEVAPERWRRVARGSLIEVSDRVADSLVEQPSWQEAGAGTPDAPADTPPGGTVADVTAWVDGNPDRARVALTAERAGKGRKKLLELLEQLVDEPVDVNNGAERPEEDNTDG